MRVQKHKFHEQAGRIGMVREELRGSVSRTARARIPTESAIAARA